MANFAIIEEEFTGFSDLNASFQVRFVNATRGIDVTFTWICKTVRSAAFQYEQGSDIIEQTDNLANAGNADIQNSSIASWIFQGGIDDDTVTFEANEFGWVITDEITSGTTNITPLEVPEVLPAKDFQLTGFSLGTAIVPCVDIELTITQNGDGVAPFTWITPSNASTTFVAQIARQATTQSISVTIEDSETDQATLNSVTIPKLSNSTDISNISIVTNVGGFDATVTIFMVDPSGILFDYKFSLDGIIFQSSNVFPNVLDGAYTVHVDDGFGCIFTDTFDVDTATTIPRILPHAAVPKAQSFRFVQQTANQFNTLENSLYQNEFYLGEHKPQFFQPFQTNDGIIPSQFQSNYDELSARRLDCDGNIVETFSIVKKSDNIGVQDKRDAIAFNRGNNQAGVFFTTGNIYDPGTLDIIDTYELNGEVPEWGVVGNTMVLTGVVTGSFVIKQVVKDVSVNATALIFDFAWQSPNQSEAIIAEITYNRLNFEIHEFDFDTGQAPLLDGVFSMQILMTDSLAEYPDVAFNSEFFEVKNEHVNTNFIQWSESPNSGLDYSTGFTGKIRIVSKDPYADVTPGGESTEYNDALLETIKLKDSATLEGEMFFQEQARYSIEKLRLIFTHKNILVNGEKWTNIKALDVIHFRLFSLKNAVIKLRRNNYEEYKTDNIDVNGDKAAILQESGSILI